MAQNSTIEWTDATWNPITGCTKISSGCDNCYAERFAERFRNVPGHPYQNGFDLTLRPDRLLQPLNWKAPRVIFVNSMSDLFHKQIPSAFVEEIFCTMERATWHIFQVLTKRSSLMRKFMNQRYAGLSAPENIWAGVSVEDATKKSRIEHLRQTRASTRFISFEPLIGPIGNVDLSDIHWAIAGGESGPKYRPMQLRWAREVRDQCVNQSVAFFFKQWGGLRPKSGGRQLDGCEWNQYPSTSVVVDKIGASESA